MKIEAVEKLIRSRVGKALTITFRSGEVVRAKIISVDALEEDTDFYFIDLDRAPANVEEIDEGRMKHHVYPGTFEEVSDLETPDVKREA